MSEVTILLLLFAQGAAVNLLAALVPGPDVLLVLRCAVARGRTAGLLAATGVGCGLVIYSITALLFATLIIAAPPVLFVVTRYVGAAYLGYLGLCLLASQGKVGTALLPATGGGYVTLGFATNLTNPKVVLFFLAVLTQFDAVRGPLAQRAALLAGIFAGAMVAFTLVSLGGGWIHGRLTPAWVRRIDRVAGLLLLGFAVALLAGNTLSR